MLFLRNKNYTKLLFFIVCTYDLWFFTLDDIVLYILQDGRLTFDPGSRVVKLPFVNYLRELGVTFLYAYTNSPICCPSRAG